MSTTNFEKIISVLNLQKRESLEQEIKTRYTPKLFTGEELVERSSLEGYIIDLIREWTSLDSESKKWKHVFRKAFSSLSDDYADQLGLSVDQRIELFELEFQYKKRSSSEKNHSFISETYDAPVPLHWTKDPIYLTKRSLFRDWDKEQSYDISSQIFENLFQINQNQNLNAEDHSALFLHAIEHVKIFFPFEGEEIRILIAEANYNAAQLNRCIASGFELDDEKRNSDLRGLSKEIFGALQALQTGEKKLIFCPVKEASPNMNFLNLPKDNPYVRLFENFIGQDKSSEIEDVFLKEIEKFVYSLQNSADAQKIIGGAQLILEQGMTEAVFSKINESYFDDNQDYSKKIQSALQELFRRKLKDFLKSSETEVVNRIAEYVPLAFTKEICLELCQAVKDGDVAEVLQKQLKPILAKLLKKVVNELRGHFFSLTDLLPPVASEMFTHVGLGVLGSPKSNLWLEFERQMNGHFNLLIYTSGKGVAVQGVVPLIYKDLSSHQLDVNFFLRLLSFIALNEWEEAEESFDLQDIHKGLFLPLDVEPSLLEKRIQTIGEEVQGIQTTWGVLKAFISTKLPFAMKKDRDLFFFVWKKKVLIDYYMLVQENPSFKENLKEYASIPIAAKALSKEALELFNQKQIDFEELQKIYATTWEILEVFKDKPKKNYDKIKPHILPLPIIEGIHFLFKNNYKHAVLLRNIIIDVLGDEVKAGLDAVLEDLAIPVETSQVTIPEKIEADFYQSDRKWVNIFMDATVGFDLDDLENPTTLSYIKIAFGIGRLALAIIFSEAALLLLGGWAIFSIAKAALTHYVKDVYPEEYQQLSQKANEFSEYLEEWRLKIIVRAASYLFLNEDQRENLKNLVQTWQAYLTHQGKLSFEIDALAKPEKSLFDIKKVTFKIELKNEISKDYINNRPVSRPRIDEHNCYEYLLNCCEKESCDEEFILHLPSPLDACWERVSDHQDILEYMMYATGDFYKRCNKIADKDSIVNAIVCLFKCYAIIDKLARRCPEAELDGYSSNPYALVFLKKNAFFQIKDSNILCQFIDICNYFKIDYCKDYNDNEFNFLVKGSVFKPSPNRDKSCDSSFPEKYYKAILKKKETQLKFKELNVSEDTPDSDKLSLIYADGRVNFEKSSGVRFLPRPFHLLRMANLWVNELISARFDQRHLVEIDGIEDFPAVFQEGDHPLRKKLQTFSLDQWFNKEDTWIPFKKLPGYKENVQSKGVVDVADRNVLAGRETVDCLGNRHAWKYFRFSGRNCDISEWNFYRVISSCFHASARKQNDILNHPCFFDEYPNALTNLPENERNIIEMIWAEESDQAVRTIAYFSQRPDRFEDPVFRALFDLLLFRRNVLERQFKDDANFVKTLGIFFHKAIDYYTNKKNMDVLEKLIELGEICLAKARFKNPLAFQDFPHFPKILLEWKQANEEHPDLFPTYYNNLRPQDIGLEEKKELCFILCQYLMVKNSYSCSAFHGWQDEICTVFGTCKETRNRTLNAIAKSKKLIAKDVEWNGQFPWFNSGEIELSFYGKNGQRPANPEIQKLITEQTQKMFGHSMTPRFVDGKYSNPFYSVKVKEVDGCTKLIFTRWVDSINYRLVELDTQNEKPDISYWLEKGKKPIKKLLVIEGARKVIETKMVAKDEETGQFQEIEVEAYESQRYVDLKKDRHSLHLLTRFQPLETITVSRDENGITQIDFKDLGISFVIATHKGKKYAEGVEGLSGFFISEEQQSPKISALNFHSRYLLLENHQNQHKVILLSETFCTNASLWLVNQVIPFSGSHLLDQLSDKALKPFFEQMTKDKALPKYYVYTLDEKGKLYSEDPMALFHLLTHALAHDHSENFIHYLILIERIGRRFPFSKELFQYIKFIHVAALCSQDQLFLRASLRLAAILEENALIQIKSESPILDIQESALEWIVLQMNYFRYLKEADQKIDYLPLDEYQELFILHAITQRAQKIVQMSMKEASEFKSLIEKIDPKYVVETLLMPPEMCQRYVFLKAKHENQGEEQSFLNSIYDKVRGRAFNSLLSTGQAFNNLLYVKDPSDIAPGIQETFMQNVIKGLSLKSIEKLLTKTSIYNLEFKNSCYSFVENYDEHWKNSKFLNLYLGMLKSVWNHIPIDFLELTPEGLNNNFFYYYQLATGEPPLQLEDDDQQLQTFKQKSGVFKQSLKVVQGKKFEGCSLLLVLQLASQANRWISFPSPQELEKKLQRLIYAESENLKNPSSLSPNYFNEFHYYLYDFNDKILSMCYAYLLAPTIKKGLQSIGEIFSAGAGLFDGADNEHEKRLEIAGSEQKLTLESNQKKEGPLPDSLLERMEKEDRRLGAFPKKLLHDHFKPLKITQQGKSDKGKEELVGDVSENQRYRQKAKIPIKPFACPSKDPFIQKEFDCFNRELVDGYNRPGDQEYPHEILGIRDYFEIKHGLEKEIKKRKVLLKELRQSLQKSKEKAPEPSDEDQLTRQMQEQHSRPQKTLEIQSKFNERLKDFINNKESCKDQELLFYFYLVISTSTQQLVRAFNLANRIDPKRWSDDETKVLCKELGFELGRDRAYPFDGSLPTKLLRGYLAFEEGTGLMLWDKLVKPLQKMLLDEHSNVISQIPTGVGKTTCEKPLVNYFSSGQIVNANIFPPALAKENIRYLFECNYKVSRLMTNVVNFIRQRMSVDQLWAFEMMLKRSLENQETVNACKEDFQTFRQGFFEEILLASQNPKNMDKSLIWAYMKVCSFIRTKVKGNFEEMDSVVDHRKVLNHPFGKPQRIKREYEVVIFATMRLLFTIPEIEERVLIATNDQTLCTPKQYKEIIKPLLAEGMCSYKPFNIQYGQKKLFIDYLCGKSKTIPDFVLKHPLKQEIFLCRGLINDILSRTLNQRINVDFGIEGNPYGYAQIYSGKDTPVVGAIFKNPLEAIVKTIICWRFISLTPSRTKKLIEKMVVRAKEEVKNKGINFEETEAGCLFYGWTKQSYQLKAFMDSSNVDLAVEENITELFNQSYAARMSYAVIPIEHILFYPINMFCTSYNATSMFASYNGSTATPSIQELSPNHAKIFKDPGAIGDAIYLIDNACVEKEGITVLKNREPKKAYKELLKSNFQWQSRHVAVIDGSALFNGLKNEEAASMALKFIKQSRPNVDAFVYYQGNDCVIQVVDKAPVPFRSLNLPLSKRLTYYDATHSTGADIKQAIGGIGSVSISETETIGKLVQAGGRMRGLKTLQQSIALFTNQAAKEIMTHNRELKVRDIIAHLQMNEAQKNKEGVFPSAQQRVDDFLSSVIYDAMISANSVDEAMKFAIHLDFFIEKANYDDMTFYGLPKSYQDGGFAFKQYCDQKFEPIRYSPLFTEPQKQKIYFGLMNIGANFTFPRVKMPNNQGKINFHRHDIGFSQQVSIDVSQNQDVDLDLQQQQNQNIHQNQDLFVTGNKNHEKKIQLRSKPAPWDKNVDYFTSLDWLFGEEQKSLHKQAEVYRVVQSLCISEGVFSSVAKAFGGNLFWTNNLRGIQGDLKLASVCTEKPIFMALIIEMPNPSDEKFRYLTCMMDHQGDVEFWRSLLSSEKRGTYKMALYDLWLGAVVMRGNDEMDLDQLESNARFQFDISRAKYLAGNPNFTKKEMLPKMERWINKFGKDEMKQAFQEVYAAHGITPLKNSQISHIFSLDEKDALPDLLI